jgi:tripartite-type tricarboxylate transporter receptor subunit TctC
MKETGIDIVNISYKGGAPSILALQAGEVQVTLGSLSGSLPLVQDGALKALAVSTLTRNDKLPTVPTLAEAADLPGFEASEWYGAVAPAKIPQAILVKLHDDIVDALKSPDVQKVTTDLGFRTVGNTSDQFAKTISGDIARWTEVMKTVEIK